MNKGFGSKKAEQPTKRQKAYFKLIEKLLGCPRGGELKILRKHEHLVDAGLVETMEMVAQILAGKGNRDSAYFLMEFADWLVEELGLSRSNTSADDKFIQHRAFLGQVLWEIARSQNNPQAVNSLLVANLDKLNQSFYDWFRHWVEMTLLNSDPEAAQVATLGINHFCVLLWQFPLGERKINLEIAITGLEAAAQVFTCEIAPKIWANIQVNLAPAYRHRILGHRVTNQEKAITACNHALLIYTRDGFPEEWARVQNNLGIVYTDRITGDKAENLEKSIACYEGALQVVIRSQLPELWGTLQHNLGHAYLSRIQGDEAQNLEKAIACYQVALQVRTRTESPYYWASSQHNLGNAYGKRRLGLRQQNLERAISAYINALEVYTASDYPERWARAKCGLGEAYREIGQITEALECLRAALEVFTPTSFPRDCRLTGVSLGDTALAVGMKAEALAGYAIAIEAVEKIRFSSGIYREQLIPEEVFAYIKIVVFCLTNGERDKARQYAERSGSQQVLDLLDSRECQQIYSNSQFLDRVLQVTASSNSNSQILYQFLTDNLDKLDEKFIDYLELTKEVLRNLTIAQSLELAATIFDFSNLIRNFPQSDESINLKIATTGYEVAATVFTKEAFPEQWGNIQDALREVFLGQLLKAVFENLANTQGSYRLMNPVPTNYFNSQQFPPYINWPTALMKANKDKLDERFVNILRARTTAMLSETPPEHVQVIARILMGLSLAILEFRQGNEANNLEIAITGFQMASTVLTCDNPQVRGMCQTLLANAYHRRIKGKQAENLERSIDHLNDALQVVTRSDFPELWAEIQNNLLIAYGYRIRGDKAENVELAISAGEAAMQVYTRDNLPERWAAIQNNLGIVYRDRVEGDKAENLERAIVCYQNALSIRTREDFPELWAQTQMNLGSAYRHRLRGDAAENLELAIAANLAALQVYTKDAFPKDWAGVQMNLANVYLHRIHGNKTENLEMSIAAHRAALQILTKDELPQQWAMTQMNLGNVYFRQEQEEEAITCYRSALAIFTPTAFPAECLNTGRMLGKTAFIVGDWAEAIKGYSIAIEAVETSRIWANSEFRRQQILAESLDIYQEMVRACINNRNLDKAIEYVERSRSKSLVDLMASNDLYSNGEIPPEIQQYLQEFENLQRQIDNERSRHYNRNNLEVNEVGNNRQERAALKAYNETISFLEAEKLLIWEQIRSLDPVLAGQIKVTPINLSSIQQLIDVPTSAILSFYTTFNDTHIFVIRQSKITLFSCNGMGFEALQGWIYTHWLEQYIENKDTWKEQFSQLTVQLAQALHLNDLIAQHLNEISELIIVPHLALHQIPFAALPIGNGQYLGDKFLIRYIPSCKILEFCQQRPSVDGHLSYGTVEDATEDLPLASFEGEQLATLYNISDNQRLKGSQQATVNNYRKLVQKVQIIHSCHHAQSRIDNPLESSLILGDGCITLGQLTTPAWRMAQLSDVFLSCCETGLGIGSIADDIFNFSTAFLCAGARSVISTLWGVDDLATALFSLFYYQHRQRGSNRVESVRQAQIELRNLTGEALATGYQSRIIFLLNQKGTETNALRKQAQKERSSHPPGSELYERWDQNYQKRDIIGKLIYQAKTNLENFCRESKPFSHPFYWAAFTCSGLS